MIGSIRFRHNFDAIADRIANIGESFRADNSTFVEDIQEISADGMQARAAAEVDPRFTRWDENDPEYKTRKGGLPIGVGFTGEMLAPANLRGIATVSKERITFRYAGSAAARQKLAWFHAGGRPAWGWDDQIKAKIRERIGQEVRENLHGA